MREFIEHIYNDIGRQYIFSNGKCYFSVTTVLDASKDKSGLDAWRKRVGHQQAEFICNVAKKVGTEMHEALENFLLSRPYGYSNPIVKGLTNQIIPYLTKRVKHVYSTEKILWSDKLQLAGTADAFVDYLVKNRTIYCVLDFKTAKRVPKIEWIQDYFIQMYIYSQMIAEMTGSSAPEYGVLLFAFKEQKSTKNQIIVKLAPYEDRAMRRIDYFHNVVNKT